MKKRAFLSPLAASVAALLSVSSAPAAVLEPGLGKVEAVQRAAEAALATNSFVIERSDRQKIETAYHYSHRSHSSHQSHRSHYSSRY